MVARGSKQNIFQYGRPLGDIVASLATVKQLGGGDYAIGYRENGQRETMAGSRFDAIKPLLEAQPYIQKVFWSDTIHPSWHDFSTFRKHYKRHGNLALQHAEHIGVKNLNLDPWLIVPSLGHHGKVVAARSLRYQNREFPWGKLCSKHRGNMIFVGLEAEHKAFCKASHWHVPFHFTSDLLKLAQAIAGSSLFISNQSCPFWIAAGLGVSLIQEVWSGDQNSIVERPNAFYAIDLKTIRNLVY